MSDALVVAIATVLGTALGVAINQAIEGRRRRKSDQDLLDRKHQLDQYSDLLKYTIQQELVTAELRVRSKHRVYPRLSKKCHLAIGVVSDLFKVRSLWTFDRVTRDKFVKAVETESFTPPQKEEILEAFDRAHHEGTSRFHDSVERNRTRNAWIKVNTAYNYTLQTRLYCIDEVTELANQIYEILAPMISHREAENIMLGLGNLNPGEIPERTARAVELMNQLDFRMRDDLSPKPAGKPDQKGVMDGNG
ncbi:MAG: hypothetical protein ACJ79H_02435 [Myxococcales bacterium]